MFVDNIIELVQTECAVSIVIVSRKDEDLQIFFDFCEHNAVTEHNSNPVSHMNKCIDSLGKPAVFHTLDVYSGYWRIKIEDRDKIKKSFTLHHGLNLFIRNLFELCSAPGTSLRNMDVIHFMAK